MLINIVIREVYARVFLFFADRVLLVNCQEGHLYGWLKVEF